MAKTLTPAQVALVRSLYLEGATLRAIRAASGIRNNETIYRCLKGDFDDGSGTPPAPIPKRGEGVRVHGRHGSRKSIVARMWRTAERQVEEIEERLKSAGIEPDERESNARTLAIVAKTLRDLATFDEAKNKRGQEASKDDDDKPVPRNVDELRRALADKLEKFAAGESNRLSGGVE